MAYGTPVYDYEQQRSNLTQRKGLEDVGRDYARFMSQERFRRQNQDQSNQFRDNMPKVGTHFNRRGMWNSGLRRQGQQRFAQDFSQAQDRTRFDQAAEGTQFDMAQSMSDANHQQALLQLFEQLQQQRAAGYDPFSAVR
jgi:hypothetical protein